MRKAALALLALVLLSACSEDEPQNSVPAKPQVTLINPVDSFPHTGPIPVDLQFSDDNGLQEVSIAIGSLASGNQTWHASVRGLSGTSDQLSYEVEIPEFIDVIGENFITVRLTDTESNLTILDEEFTIYFSDAEKPVITSLNAMGVLTTNPAILTGLSFGVSDNNQVAKVLLEAVQVNGANNEVGILASAERVVNQPMASGSIEVAGDPGLTPGTTYQLRLTVFDAAGNTAVGWWGTIYQVQS